MRMKDKQRRAMFARMKGKTYNQIRRLNPNGDIDRDGIKNSKDCRPLDPNRQGKIHDFLVRKLKEREQKLENKRIQEQKKLEAIREKLEQKKAITNARFQETQKKQAIIDEIKREKQAIKDLKEANKQAKKEIFNQSITGRTLKATGNVSKSAIDVTQKFFKKKSTKRFLKKIFD